MTRQTRCPSLAIAVSLALLTATPAGVALAQGAPQIYGSQFMTEQERFAYRQRFQNAPSAEERERIRGEHHQNTQERARQQGVTLPDQPPVQGMRQGLGTGLGQGQGGGIDRGRGRTGRGG